MAHCNRKVTEELTCKFTSLGASSMLLMTLCIVLDVTIALYKNVSAQYLV